MALAEASLIHHNNIRARTEHAEQALREYMQNHVSEFDEKMQGLCIHDTWGITD